MYDFVIFDLDGTLVDSQRDITSAVNSVRKEFNFAPLSIGQVRSFLGSGIKSLIERSVPCGNGKVCADDAVERFKFYYAKCLTDTTKAYGGITEMLDDLKDVKKAVLSNKTEIFSREILERLGILKYFSYVWGGDTIGVKKPDPQPILDLVKNSGISAAKTIMIGDSANDFKAAKSAGVACAAVMYGYSTAGQIAEFKPDFLIQKPSEIAQIVL
ncbi:MAG: HAD-IA family hydrolase [Endomicrobium sp.]|jgi:phosphoglycolate phosphatase|nr:HAD-IA family hydrolase [Endomicrobium sp.]